MATAQRTTSSEARARVLLENAANWSRGTAITATGETVGVVLFASSRKPKPGEPHRIYITRCDGAGCDCPGAQRTWSGMCCHMIAVQTEAAAAREAAAVKPRARYDEVFVGSGFELTDAF